MSKLSSHLFKVRIPAKFAQSHGNIWIQLFQQFIGIYSKSNVKTSHKNVKHETLCCQSSRFDI